ncbi:hypothetical protein CRYUN_Cryun03dG0042700 [Craigia yunnanensis]
MAPCLSRFFLFFITFSATLTTPANSLPAFFPRAAYRSLIKQVKTSKSKIPFKTHYFPQTLDHFTFQPKSSKIFYQKYLINSHYWHKGAPIFVYTGNEGDIEWFAANTGFMLDIAPKFKALLESFTSLNMGESMPFGKDSYQSAKTLGYLNSQQDLADFAVLIRSLKQNLSSEASPVVVFGGSYGGTWFILKYHHIAIGALASSAPILQFDKIIPWSSFYDAVSQDFKFRSLHLTASARDWLWTAFVYTALVNYPTEANFLKPLPAYPVQQTCTEMVMPMTCSKVSMFPPSGFDYEEFAEQCQMKYGVLPKPHWITTEFGGERIQKVLKRFGSNIIFSSGMQDPWSSGGILKNISSSIIVLVTEKGAHHVDFRSATKDDRDWLIEQRRLEVEIIQKWLNEYYADLRHA